MYLGGAVGGVVVVGTEIFSPSTWGGDGLDDLPTGALDAREPAGLDAAPVLKRRSSKRSYAAHGMQHLPPPLSCAALAPYA
jgi:hypothetical protein